MKLNNLLLPLVVGGLFVAGCIPTERGGAITTPAPEPPAITTTAIDALVTPQPISKLFALTRIAEKNQATATAVAQTATRTAEEEKQLNSMPKIQLENGGSYSARNSQGENCLILENQTGSPMTIYTSAFDEFVKEIYGNSEAKDPTTIKIINEQALQKMIDEKKVPEDLIEQIKLLNHFTFKNETEKRTIYINWDNILSQNSENINHILSAYIQADFVVMSQFWDSQETNPNQATQNLLNSSNFQPAFEQMFESPCASEPQEFICLPCQTAPVQVELGN